MIFWRKDSSSSLTGRLVKSLKSSVEMATMLFAFLIVRSVLWLKFKVKITPISTKLKPVWNLENLFLGSISAEINRISIPLTLTIKVISSYLIKNTEGGSQK
jgi:hypothetical protein